MKADRPSLRRRSLMALALAQGALGSAFAQAPFPAKQVHLLVPFPPGGASDAMMRIVASQLQEIWKQPVVVENKPGAGTVIGSNAVAKASPDGHTIGLVTASHVINEAARRKLPYDTLKDLAPVAHVAEVHQAILARADSPASDVRELVALSKARGRVTVGTAGVGTAGHLFSELLNTTSGAALAHVAYKGSSPAQVDLLAGHVDFLVDALSAHQGMVKAGRMKVVALASPERHPAFPQIATTAEIYPGVSVESFFGIVAPSATPRPVLDMLTRDLIAAMQEPQTRQRVSELGLMPTGRSGQQFDAMVRSQIQKWSDLITKTGLRIDEALLRSSAQALD